MDIKRLQITKCQGNTPNETILKKKRKMNILICFFCNLLLMEGSDCVIKCPFFLIAHSQILSGISLYSRWKCQGLTWFQCILQVM